MKRKNIDREAFENETFVFGENAEASLNCVNTGRNNNVLVIGTTGSGKTRTVVIPNLIKAVGSYIVSDPKGTLYKNYAPYLESLGYDIYHVSFIHPEESDGYNPFHYAKTNLDIIRIAHTLVGENNNDRVDPYWDRMAEVLVSALIGYMLEVEDKKDQNIEMLHSMIEDCHKGDKPSLVESSMLFLEKECPNSFAVSQWKKVRSIPLKTYESILSCVEAKIGLVSGTELFHMLSESSFSFSALGRKKSALFVEVSDTDRSLDMLANLFFTQAMQELSCFADNFCSDERLPVDVRFFLDDFATNVAITEFPRMISAIRSRGISCVMMIQSESQLAAWYGQQHAKTIINNCDSILYLGGNDLETMKDISLRTNKPLEYVESLGTGYAFLFQRGEKPKKIQRLDLERYASKLLEERREKELEY